MIPMLLLQLALLLQAAPPSMPAPAPLGAIGQQALPARGCAAFLWSAAGDRNLIAMAGADPARLRLSIGGRTLDLDRAGQNGAGNLGFAQVTDYGAGDLRVTLDMTIATRADLAGGATVPSGTLVITRPAQDVVVVPVAGLIGCT
ncbi:MAG TPA: hypothetical protein VF649_06270 [Sphingomonas sp.]|uniref:hypothetical protein n=1 Tax=Sphingomonas sp. TaxID=28214 RepID=UPI002EDB8F25